MRRDGLLWSAVAFYAAVLFFLGTLRYQFHHNFVDLGIFAQTASSAFGCFCNSIEGSHWAFHFSPIILAAGLLLRVWPSALALIALQAVAGALTAPPIYGIALRHTDRQTARLCALVVLLYPPLAGAIFNDFHENGLAPAAVAWMMWAFDGGYVIPTIVLTLLAVCVKEDQALFAAAAAALGAIAYRRDPLRFRLCLFGLAAGLTVALLFFGVIQPHARALAAPGWAPVRFYSWTRADWNALFPSGLLARAGFFVLAFAPLLFLPFRTPYAAVAALPLCEVVFSRMATTYTNGSHYAGAWAGWVLYAYVIAVSTVWRNSPVKAQRLAYWCLAVSLLEFAIANPLHPGYFLRGDRAADVALDRFLQYLPRDSSIATQEEAYTHLAAIDSNATLLPESSTGRISACFVLTDADFPESPRLVESKELVDELVTRARYVVARRSGNIILYRSASKCR